MPSLDCGGCTNCEREWYAPFLPGEEWKFEHYKDVLFCREGIWFLGPLGEGDCPYFKDERCTIHGEPWRPLGCQIYPCYVDEEGELRVDYEGCPMAHKVDEKFMREAKSLIDSLGLKEGELKAWARAALRHCSALPYLSFSNRTAKAGGS